MAKPPAHSQAFLAGQRRLARLHAYLPPSDMCRAVYPFVDASTDGYLRSVELGESRQARRLAVSTLVRSQLPELAHALRGRKLLTYFEAVRVDQAMLMHPDAVRMPSPKTTCKFCRRVVAGDGLDELVAARHISLCSSATPGAKKTAAAVLAKHPECLPDPSPEEDSESGAVSVGKSPARPRRNKYQ